MEKTTQDVVEMLSQALTIDKSLIHEAFTSSDHPNWDSLANMTIASVLHDIHGIKISYEQVFELNSVEKLVRFIDNNSLNINDTNIEEITSDKRSRAVEKTNSADLDINMLPLLAIEEATSILNDISHSENYTHKNITIASTFTTQALAAPLTLWCKSFATKATIGFGDFNQIEHELLSIESQFYKPGNINIVLVRPEDFISERDPKGKDRADSILNAISQYAKECNNILIISDMPPIVSEFSGEKVQIANELSIYWNEKLQVFSSVFIFELSRIIIELGSINSRDTEMEIITRSPYSQQAFQKIGINLTRLLRSISTPTKKVLALDADNTLWGGIVGEDGITQIQLGDDHPGRSFRLFQSQILALKEKGILLALVSKNEESDVLEVLEKHPGMILKNRDFASKRINWQPKSQNLKQIAKELNLGLDSIVFFDDSPVECDEVKTNAPGVTVIQLPDNPLHYGMILDRLWLFDNSNNTKEDKLRNEFVQKNEERKKLKDESGDIDSYLNSLNIQVVMEKANENTLPRIAQLSQKTNQFNTSLKRRTLLEFNELSADFSIWSIDVKDKFGDYGLVGACVLDNSQDSLIVDSLYISCRALGRNVEHAFLFGIFGIAKSVNKNNIKVLFSVGPRNQQVLDFFKSVGFTEQSNIYYSNSSVELPKHIKWNTLT